MPAALCSDEDFISLWQSLKSATKLADSLGIDKRNVLRRRRNIEAKYNIQLLTNEKYFNNVQIENVKLEHNRRLEETRHNVRRGTTLEKGRVLVFSDAHFYSDDETTAFRALLECIKEFQPEVIICNGDAFDGTTNSRHARINWSDAPSVIEELQAVQHFLGEIENASKFKENLIWTLGNHDARFETFLSSQVPQYQNIKGFSLKDHFPMWKSCWSYWVNDDTVIKHRHKGGAYAGYNNIKAAMGCNVVTGHTHVLAVQPITGYKQTFYGVQTGMLAYPKGNQFIDYTEDNPVDWRSGFVMLTWHKGQLLMPELIQVFNENEGEVQFRGKVFSV